jgi:Polymer-forming cytoskeletal
MSPEPRPQDTLTIDPVAMNVTNRVAQGSALAGDLEFEGGLLVQGTLGGVVQVRGRLIVWEGALVRGRIVVLGDLYLFGQLGDPAGDALDTQLECMGTAYVASTARSTGTLMAQRLRMYEGADLQGPFKTLRANRALPVLTQETAATN